MTNWKNYREKEKAHISYEREQIDVRRKNFYKENPDSEWGPNLRSNWRSLHGAKRRLRNYSALEDLERDGHIVRDMNQGYQFRVDNQIDIFPTNRKYHILKTGERGDYNNLPLLIKKKLGDSR